MYPDRRAGANSLETAVLEIILVRSGDDRGYEKAAWKGRPSTSRHCLAAACYPAGAMRARIAVLSLAALVAGEVRRMEIREASNDRAVMANTSPKGRG